MAKLTTNTWVWLFYVFAFPLTQTTSLRRNCVISQTDVQTTDVRVLIVCLLNCALVCTKSIKQPSLVYMNRYSVVIHVVRNIPATVFDACFERSFLFFFCYGFCRNTGISVMVCFFSSPLLSSLSFFSKIFSIFFSSFSIYTSLSLSSGLYWLVSAYFLSSPSYTLAYS